MIKFNFHFSFLSFFMYKSYSLLEIFLKPFLWVFLVYDTTSNKLKYRKFSLRNTASFLNNTLSYHTFLFKVLLSLTLLPGGISINFYNYPSMRLNEFFFNIFMQKYMNRHFPDKPILFKKLKFLESSHQIVKIPPFNRN